MDLLPTEIKYKIFEYIRFYPYLEEIKNLKNIREYNYLSFEINYINNEIIISDEDDEFGEKMNKSELLHYLELYEKRMNCIKMIHSYQDKNVFY